MSGTLQGIFTRAGTSCSKVMQLATSCCALLSEQEHRQESKTHATCPAKLCIQMHPARHLPFKRHATQAPLISQNLNMAGASCQPAASIASCFDKQQLRLRQPQATQT